MPLYEDTLHGFRTESTSREMAWVRIRAHCRLRNLPKPGFDQVREVHREKTIFKPLTAICL